MSDAKLGSLGASVIVDGIGRPHFGPGDAITGKMVLSYMPYKSLFKSNVATADLFGPLKLEATLRGKIKISVKRDREFATDCGMPLFRTSFEIFNGSFKAEVDQKYDFPFSINFPELVNGIPLPPSFSVYFTDYPDKIDSSIVYRIGCKVNMPGIDIKTTGTDYNPEPIVRLDFPRPPPSVFATPVTMFEHKSTIQHSNLLPENERPSGFKAKTKAVFSSSKFPIFASRLTCTMMDKIYPGFRPDFTITLRRLDQQTTATFFPEVNLISVRADLIADTTVDTSGRLLASPTCADRATVQKLQWRESPRHHISLSKANDYTATVQTGHFLAHASTFSHPKVARSYWLRVTVRLKIAEQSVEFNRQFPVMMIPPPSSSVQYGYDGAAVAGPSRVDAEEDEEEVLPAYHEVPAGPPKVTKESEE